MDQFRHVNENTKYASNNRVYINRNFTRIGADRIAPMSNSNMYFNPNFSHKASTHYIAPQSNPTNKPKIHVNPNFMRPQTQVASIATSSHISTISRATEQTQPIQQQTAPVTVSRIIPPVSKSRYCLVRQNESIVKTPFVTSPSIKSTQTVKVNKYKLVSLNSVKKSLSVDKKPVVKSIQPTQNKLNQTIIKSKYIINSKSPINTQNNRFKFTKRNCTLNSSETSQGMIRRVSISKSILKTSFKQTKKIAGAMKKNNIPCPLFKKYGRCLRMIRGSCDYLHDKKHVSICRKFLKGVCHDKHCLLSHDLTDKKMPTCYFYLQGNCTKEGCPYLHVKLNEKTKICPNFLKGYCENGDKCVYRHVNVTFNSTKLTKTKRCSSTNKNLSERAKIFKRNIGKESTPVKEAVKNLKENDNIKDQRYFKETTGEETLEEQYALIKPTRCKLGTLPSFIQL